METTRGGTAHKDRAARGGDAHEDRAHREETHRAAYEEGLAKS